MVVWLIEWMSGEELLVMLRIGTVQAWECVPYVCVLCWVTRGCGMALSASTAYFVPPPLSIVIDSSDSVSAFLDIPRHLLLENRGESFLDL